MTGKRWNVHLNGVYGIKGVRVLYFATEIQKGVGWFY